MQSSPIEPQSLSTPQSQTLKDTTTQAENIPTTPSLKAQQPKPSSLQKHYYFQTQTKRLKQFYLEHLQSLVSRRILFNNSAGIVRYVGELKHQGAENNDEIWVGVEWEDIGRGKHNGTVKGYKYFQCDKNQGSMVKYQKIEFGYRLQTALFKRYFKSQEMHHARNIYEELKMFKREINQKEEQSKDSVKSQSITENTKQTTTSSNQTSQATEKTEEKVQKKKIHKIQYDADAYFDSLKKTKKIMVEFVGFDQIWTKINNLDKIQSISLPQCRICDFGPRGHLNDLFKSLKVLSLQDNLLSHYNQIFQLGLELPHLEELALTNNRLAEPQLPFEQMKEISLTGYDSAIQLPDSKPIFPRLKTLVLINTGLSWKTLFKIVKAFNKLRELVLCRNDLTDYQNIDQSQLDCFDELTFLNLEETKLKNFKNLMVFKDLPKLEKLTLNKNPISQFGRQIHGFTNLKKLSVQSCQVRKPVVIYELSNFKNVENLNFKHNPLNDLIGNEYVRLRSIAQFQKLTIINGAPLKKYERKDSEIFYMRESFREYFHAKNRPDYDYDFNDFLKWCDEFHPNIQMFIKKYGNPYEVEQKKEIKEIIKNEVKQVEMKKGTGMVKVKIHFEELGSTDERKIPMTWTLASLKNFLAKTTKIPSGMQVILHKNETQKLDEEIVEDHKQLSFYNITEESTLTLRRKNTKGGISFVV